MAGISPTADPENLTESDFYALDPARVTANGRLAVTRLLDDTLWVENSPSKCWGEIRSQSPPARRAFFCLDHDKCRLSFTTLPVKMRLERSAERSKREI